MTLPRVYSNSVTDLAVEEVAIDALIKAAEPSAAASIIQAWTAAPGAGPHSPLAMTNFADQAGAALAGAALTAHLAAMGLTVNAGHDTFTVAPGGAGVFAITVTTLTAAGPTANKANLQIVGLAGGFATTWTPTLAIPAASASDYRSIGYVDAFADGDSFQLGLTQNGGETDLADVAIAIVRIR